ncbi:MAG: DNA translocase FtsK 4TM domain-containing protein, partial [Gammaproteobacteria bacterium]
MVQASKKRHPGELYPGHLMRNIKEISLIALGALSIFLAIALATYHPQDPGWSQAVSSEHVRNSGGIVGAWVANFLLYLFGYLGYLFPAIAVFDSWRIFASGRRRGPIDEFQIGLRIMGFVLAFAGGCGLAWMYFQNGAHLPQGVRGAGGIFGDGVGSLLLLTFGSLGSTLVLLATFFIGVTLYTGLSWIWLMDKTGYWTLEIAGCLSELLNWLHDQASGRRLKRERELSVRREKQRAENRPPPRIEPIISEPTPGIRVEKEKQEHLFAPPVDSVLPPLGLLDEPPPAKGHYSKETLEAMSRQVELKLADFGVEVQVVAVHPGPVITRFELLPAPGVKGSQIGNLSKDLARSLSVVSVRVVDVIPGKSVVGLEIPNEYRELVTLGEILKSAEYEAT